MPKARRKRQAVVVIHGMGEHRPLDTLNGFIKAGLQPIDGGRRFYSRPDKVAKSYEARRYLAPREPADPTKAPVYEQTEFYEYHWAHLMQGNKFGDIWPTFTRLLLRSPATVPDGLVAVWWAFWILIVAAALFFLVGPGREFEFTGNPIEDVVRTVLGTGLIGGAAIYVIVTIFGGWVTSSFVDVVRYLDTSPRSYEVRRNIREGIVSLLQGLHDSPSNYQRIIVVAHSLGSYIAYDAISYLWGQMNEIHAGPPGPGVGGTKVPDGLRELEAAAFDLNRAEPGEVAKRRAEYRALQQRVWLGLRANGNAWRITDLITFGSPMYFADRLYTADFEQFRERVGRRELPLCPPLTDERPRRDPNAPPVYSYRRNDRAVLYHGAPFAVVRWTNMWFPARLSFFGDWFGGELGPLFGRGIEDIRLEDNDWTSKFPAWAHARYFSFPDDTDDDSVTKHLRDTMDLKAEWVPL